jgi:hypothetical protein
MVQEETYLKEQSFCRCFRCQAGCIHVVCGNITLTLSPAEFLVLAESLNAMRHKIREETRRAREDHETALLVN